MAGVYKKLEGVAKDPAPKVDFKAKTVTLSYDPEKLNEEKLVAALKETKFKATPVKENKEEGSKE